jgi:uncharacterized protein (TIGR03086 family)
MQPSSDGIDDLRRALDQTGLVVDAVEPEQGGLATPCDRWSVKDLVDHIVSGLAVFRRMALGEPRGEFHGELGNDDWAGQYKSRAGELLSTWRELAAGGGDGQKPPSETILGLTTMDVVIHGWDLAQATGQQPSFDTDLGERVLVFAHGFVRPEGRAATREGTSDRVPLGPAVPVPDDAPVYTRLASFLGRTVSVRPL